MLSGDEWTNEWSRGSFVNGDVRAFRKLEGFQRVLRCEVYRYVAGNGCYGKYFKLAG